MSTEVVGHPTGSALGVVTAMLSIGVIVVRVFLREFGGQESTLILASSQGSPFFGWLSDWKGRKITMFIGSCIMYANIEVLK